MELAAAAADIAAAPDIDNEWQQWVDHGQAVLALVVEQHTWPGHIAQAVAHTAQAVARTAHSVADTVHTCAFAEMHGAEHRQVVEQRTCLGQSLANNGEQLVAHTSVLVEEAEADVVVLPDGGDVDTS